MNELSTLERRYRRWLAFYPTSFLAEHEKEILDVLMQGAEPGQVRPRPGEVASLAANGLRRRVGRRLPGDWERAHAKVMFPVRMVIALWLCFVSAMLITFDRGEVWLAVLVPVIGLHLWIAYQIRPRVHHL